MKPIAALMIAVLAGTATFQLQSGFEPQAHAAGFRVPTGPDWREQMIERDPGAAGVDRALDRLTHRLDLSAGQASKARQLLEQRHERILALLVAGPASLTLAQFMADRQKINAEMHDRVDALLTGDQLELANQLGTQTRA